MRTSVLVADDDLQIVNLVRSMLTSRGYEVRTAGDAESAIASIGARPPALVLTDLELPGMSGIELCRRLRERSNVPIVVMSRSTDCANEVAALDAGADDYSGGCGDRGGRDVTVPGGTFELKPPNGWAVHDHR